MASKRIRDAVLKPIVVTVASGIILSVLGYAATAYVDARHMQVQGQIKVLEKEVNQNKQETQRQYQTIEKIRDMLYDLHKDRFPAKHKGK